MLDETIFMMIQMIVTIRNRYFVVFCFVFIHFPVSFKTMCNEKFPNISYCKLNTYSSILTMFSFRKQTNEREQQAEITLS